MYFKMNIMVHLGRIAGMTTTTSIYFVGGAIHLIVALVFGLVYALIFQPLMHSLPGFLSGAIFSLLPFILAMTLMGQFTNLIQTVFKVQKTCAPTQMMCNPCIPMEVKPSEVYEVGPSVPAEKCSPIGSRTPLTTGSAWRPLRRPLQSTERPRSSIRTGAVSSHLASVRVCCNGMV